MFGDFGHARINANNGGRDHWNFCYSLMLTAAASSRPHLWFEHATGRFPTAVRSLAILSTMYAALGFPTARFTISSAARTRSAAGDVTDLLV